MRANNRVIISGNVRFTPIPPVPPPEELAAEGGAVAYVAAPHTQPFQPELPLAETELVDYCFVTIAPITQSQSYK